MSDTKEQLKEELYELYQDTHSFSQLCAVINKHLPEGLVAVNKASKEPSTAETIEGLEQQLADLKAENEQLKAEAVSLSSAEESMQVVFLRELKRLKERSAIDKDFILQYQSEQLKPVDKPNTLSNAKYTGRHAIPSDLNIESVDKQFLNPLPQASSTKAMPEKLDAHQVMAFVEAQEKVFKAYQGGGAKMVFESINAGYQAIRQSIEGVVCH